MKEISIRKILGASEGGLVLLLSKSFLVVLLTAGMIALPTARFFFLEYALDKYADRLPVAWDEMMMAVAGVMVVAIIMIGTHTLKVARTNPADVLKDE